LPIPKASDSFIFLLLGNLFLSPFKPKEVEEKVADDDKDDDDDGDGKGEEGEVGDVSSFLFVRLLSSTGTNLIVALSWPVLGTEYLSRSFFNGVPGNCWLSEYSASFTKVNVAIVGRWSR